MSAEALKKAFAYNRLGIENSQFFPQPLALITVTLKINLAQPDSSEFILYLVNIRAAIAGTSRSSPSLYYSMSQRSSD